MNIIFCGDRNWTDACTIEKVFLKIREAIGEFTLIEGDARGADLRSLNVAVAHNSPYKRFPADWGKHGKAAGPIRNRQMVTEGKANAVVAFHSNIATSKGTKDMVSYAIKQGLPTVIIKDYNLEVLEDFIDKLWKVG